MLIAFNAMTTGLCYAELSSSFPSAGGGYIYINKAFPGFLSYLGGISFVLGYIISAALYLKVFHDYIDIVNLPPVATLFAVVLFLALINIKGVKESGFLQTLLTGIKILVLAVFVLLGLRYFHLSNLPIINYGGIFKSIGLLFVTSFGFEVIATTAEETNKLKTLVWAIIWTIIITTLIYVLVSIVTLGVLVKIPLSGAETAVLKASEVIFKNKMIIEITVLISVFAASNATILAGSRVVLGMARDGRLPKSLGEISSRYKTPFLSIFFVSFISFLLVLYIPLDQLAEVTTFLLIVAITLVDLSLIVLRRKFPNIERPFKVPFYPVTPILGALISSVLVFSVPLPQIFEGLGFILLILMFYPIGKFLKFEKKFITYNKEEDQE